MSARRIGKQAPRATAAGTAAGPRRLALAARRLRWLVPGLGVKRYVLLLVIGLTLLLLGFLQFARVGPWVSFWNWLVLRLTDLSVPGRAPLWVSGVLIGSAGVLLAWASVVMLNRSILRAMGASPDDTLDTMFTRRALGRGPRIVAIGGGTGLSNLLSGLKTYSANLTAIVAVTDDGGSSGRLRRSLGMPAPGDLTDCYAALSDSPILARLLLHRFERGEGLEGHTFGNLLLATLSEERGDFAEAVGAINEILNVRGRVVPATSAPATLVAELADGERWAGESTLRDRPERRAVLRMHLEPADPPAMPEAVTAILAAEMVVLGPGSLYTSVIPPLLVPQVADAIRRSRARVVYVANVMTEAGETDGLSAHEHALAVAEHLGRRPDVVLVNAAPVAVETRARYRDEGADVVQVDRDRFDADRLRLHLARLTRGGGGQHDPHALAATLIGLLVRHRVG